MTVHRRSTPWVRHDLAPLFANLDFEGFLRLGQHPVRVTRDGARATSWFERGERRFFLKVHHGVGWREILKCLLQGKRASVDARDEARALERLAELSIGAPRLVAFGVEGANPAKRRSFVITEALEDCEELPSFWKRVRPATRLRRHLARELGRVAGTLHGAGLVHQDLYLAHVLVRLRADQAELFLLDLHRAHAPLRRFERLRRKDLTALRYSSLALASRADCARFWRAYQAAQPGRVFDRSLRSALEVQSQALARRVARRGETATHAP
jgi:heptose I phosphotransferase